ncbi:MAG: hypothetical protein AAF989_03980, partial [Planctomycetota bacterium]
MNHPNPQGRSPHLSVESISSGAGTAPKSSLVSAAASRFYDDRRFLVLIVLLIVVAGLSSLAVLPRMEDPVLNRRVAIINT